MTDDVGPDPGGRSRASVESVRWTVVARDLIVVVAWVGVLTYVWGQVGWPMWGYYVAVFGGILGYTAASGLVWRIRGG